jgi:hypothetical protein
MVELVVQRERNALSVLERLVGRGLTALRFPTRERQTVAGPAKGAALFRASLRVRFGVSLALKVFARAGALSDLLLARPPSVHGQ